MISYRGLKKKREKNRRTPPNIVLGPSQLKILDCIVTMMFRTNKTNNYSLFYSHVFIYLIWNVPRHSVPCHKIALNHNFYGTFILRWTFTLTLQLSGGKIDSRAFILSFISTTLLGFRFKSDNTLAKTQPPLLRVSIIVLADLPVSFSIR